ncbi:alpha/beta fold hydrolase [Haladaptatus salinisoli]|uniref:alpha/beta fold hydrolase n=1 Tax=Haladaptatus salinisoli TaxID=2884876 RepID=UPI001D0B7E07|nr:alpha/beta fold hydrolase [Haladaptatus salinisoli]
MAGASRSLGEDAEFAFIYGAGLHTWVWEELTPLLDGPTLTPTFPARDAEQSVRNDLRLKDYVEHISDQLMEWDVPAIVIVAHSIGGAICLDVVNELSDKVVGFVGLSAAVPPQGRSFLSCFSLRQQFTQRVLMRFAGTKPPDAVIRRSLCNGLSEAQSDRLVTEFTPESRRLYTDEVKAGVPNVPARYIKTMNDEAIAPPRQDRMIENLQTDDVVTVDAWHMAMLSHPSEIATALREFDLH